MTTGDGIAAAALALSLYTIWRQHRTDRQTKRLNDLLIQKEESETASAQKADLSANFVKVGQNNYRYRIYNVGKGSARNVQMEVLQGEELLRSVEMNRKFPYPLLHTHQPIDLMVRVHLQSPRRAVVKLSWEDDAGGGVKEIVADVF